MQKTTLTTEPFTCPSCIKKIEKALGSKDGVETVRVMFNSSRVQVSYDDQKIAPAELADDLTKLGYPVLRIG